MKRQYERIDDVAKAMSARISINLGVSNIIEKLLRDYLPELEKEYKSELSQIHKNKS